jgi:hypothetical protein
MKKLRGEDGVVAEGEEGLKALETNCFSSLYIPPWQVGRWIVY